jgi:outer membrane protein assembly factor BamE (lipoprotein component of BamABCDE complex)
MVMSPRLAKGEGGRVGLRAGRAALAGLVLFGLCACGETLTHGYVPEPGALEQITPGTSRDAVIVILGTPSTVATLNGEVFYYISGKTTQSMNFMRPAVSDQHVIAVYFNKDKKVERVADYGMKDGKLFDFVTRTTPTIGNDRSFLGQVFKGIIGGDTAP